MKLEPLLSAINQKENLDQLFKDLKKGEKKGVSIQAAAVGRPYLFAALFQALAKSVLVATAKEEEAKVIAEDIKNFVSPEKVFFFPSLETLSPKCPVADPEIMAERFKALYGLQKGSSVMVVGSAQSFLLPLVSPQKKAFQPLRFKRGDNIDPYQVVKRLVERGYSREYIVERRGEISLRGGILDVFPPTRDHPLRMDFFGDRLEEIKEFEVGSQRSIRSVKEALIFPCQDPEAEEKKRKSSVFDYLLPGSWLIIDEPQEIENEVPQFFDAKSFPSSYLQVSSILKGVYDEKIIFYTPSYESLPRSFEDYFKEKVKGYLEKKMWVIMVLSDQGRLHRIQEILSRWNMEGVELRDGEINLKSDPVSRVYLVQGNLSRGFIAPDLNLCLLSDFDIFGRKASFKKPRITTSTSADTSLSSLMDIKKGDFVVHITHGIARYKGLSHQQVDGVKREYLELEYAHGDRLFVPTGQLDRVSKYIGSGTQPPKISRLGGAQWARTKRQVKKSIQNMALDLLALYAERAQAQGYSFSKDTPWQQELEEGFPFEETLGQLSAIDQVKLDMEIPKPMDRLVCGDVGYGKTEVAVRAAFKAVVDGKQVMVLVPTTILAQQHYNTFSDRLCSYPVEVEMLSRFKSKSEQKDILKRFSQGRIDVLIGTHRLLGKDVKPKDLGLVVIDEEQRFGVTHKEHFKKLRRAVDVLTLSATPIPRTLQMALTGARDLSTIETPPEDRKPILTHVGQYDEELVQLAIKRELEREGQVFYVHNRIETIGLIARRIRKLIPEAKIAIAHGRMKEGELEKVMLDFLAREYQILLSTTIIESGIDIPQANTLIVDEADRFGLAQLYQIRGRVGRSYQRAYAYFFFKDKALTSSALARLKTLADFTELGSGIKIALRDLEIRGAGNLLGPEQSGHIALVGFDLYCQLLRQVINELQGKPQAREDRTPIDLPLDAYIPEKYIAEETTRIEMYKKVTSIQAEREALAVEEEFKDRFGEVPEPLTNLINIFRLNSRLNS